MKHRIRIWGVLFLTLFVLCGCQSESTSEDTGVETESTAPVEHSVYRTLLAGHAGEFSIVCPDKKLDQYSGITRSFRAALETLDGGKPDLVSDFEAYYPVKDCEIVIGSTTRTEGTEYEERIAALARGEYELALDEAHSRIYLLFSDTDGLLAACEALLSEVYPDGNPVTLFANFLMERGIQRYMFTCDRVLTDSMMLAAGSTQNFCGKVSCTGTATMLSFTAMAMDLIRSASIRAFWMPSSSITLTPSLSSSFASSIFSLKDREKSLFPCFMVMSLILILSIISSPYIKGSLLIPGAGIARRHSIGFVFTSGCGSFAMGSKRTRNDISTILRNKKPRGQQTSGTNKQYPRYHPNYL